MQVLEVFVELSGEGGILRTFGRGFGGPTWIPPPIRTSAGGVGLVLLKAGLALEKTRLVFLRMVCKAGVSSPKYFLVSWS